MRRQQGIIKKQKFSYEKVNHLFRTANEGVKKKGLIHFFHFFISCVVKYS